MSTALIVLKQTVVMFLYMSAGALLFKTEKMTVKGSKDIANLLVWVVIPVVIVNSFCTEYSRAKLLQLIASVAATAAGLAVSMLLASLLCKKNPVDNFGTAFSNAGFIGIPLVQAAFGMDGVFYLAGIVAIMNVLQWSYGVGILTGEKSATSFKGIFFSPIIAGTLIGLALFLTGIGTNLPYVVKSAIDGISALNAPVAMIVMGSYLMQSDIRRMLFSGHLYKVCAVRLIIIPLATLLVFRFIPVQHDILTALFIALSTPAGANVAVYAQLHDKDYPYACQVVTLTTLLSIITLPVMLILADHII